MSQEIAWQSSNVLTSFFLHAEVLIVDNTEFSLDIERFIQAYKNVQFQEDPSAEKGKRNIIRTVC